MGWTEYYRRRDALDLVLSRLRNRPGDGLPYEAVSDVFGSREELLLALQYRWSLVLRGRLDLAEAQRNQAERNQAERIGTGRADAGQDRVDLVAEVWRRTAAEYPELRRVLDEHAGELGTAVRDEQRMVALAAGLAEPGEPAEEVSRIGAAFLALVRTAGQGAKRTRRRPIDHLLQRLVAS